jgi:hypothetical protein
MSEHTFRRDRHRDMICVCCGAFEKNVNAGAHFSPDCDEVRRDHPSLIYWVSAELRCNPAPIAPPADEAAVDVFAVDNHERGEACGEPALKALSDYIAQQDYAQRRAEIAKRRNPGRLVFSSPITWDLGAGDTAVYATQDADGFWSFASWHSGPDTSGIARAAAALSQHEPRLGASRWEP